MEICLRVVVSNSIYSDFFIALGKKSLPLYCVSCVFPGRPHAVVLSYFPAVSCDKLLIICDEQLMDSMFKTPHLF